MTKCECGQWFDPEWQGDTEDIRCIDCIDIDNCDDEQYVKLLEKEINFPPHK